MSNSGWQQCILREARETTAASRLKILQLAAKYVSYLFKYLLSTLVCVRNSLMLGIVTKTKLSLWDFVLSVEKKSKCQIVKWYRRKKQNRVVRKSLTGT